MQASKLRSEITTLTEQKETLEAQSAQIWATFKGLEPYQADGKDYLLMKPIHADFALLGAYKCDEYGNCWYKGTMRNFNVVMATAADTVIAECEYIVPVGDIEPENVHTYGMCVNYIVEGDRK